MYMYYKSICYLRLSWRIDKPETASLQTRHSPPLPWKDYGDYND